MNGKIAKLEQGLYQKQINQAKNIWDEMRDPNDTEYSPWIPSGVGQQCTDDDCENWPWMPSGVGRRLPQQMGEGPATAPC
jgi:hypothetical protein